MYVIHLSSLDTNAATASHAEILLATTVHRRKWLALRGGSCPRPKLLRCVVSARVRARIVPLKVELRFDELINNILHRPRCGRETIRG